MKTRRSKTRNPIRSLRAELRRKKEARERREFWAGILARLRTPRLRTA